MDPGQPNNYNPNPQNFGVPPSEPRQQQSSTIPPNYPPHQDYQARSAMTLPHSPRYTPHQLITPMEEFAGIADRVLTAPNDADQRLPTIFNLLQRVGPEDRAAGLQIFCQKLVDRCSTNHLARFALGRMTNILLQGFTTFGQGLYLGDFWSAMVACFQQEREQYLSDRAQNGVRYKTFGLYLCEVLGFSNRMFGRQFQTNVCELIMIVCNELLQAPNGDHWKYAGQILKQSGCFLEDHFSKKRDGDGLTAMDRVMIIVDEKGHCGRVEIPYYIRSMLLNILELRAHDWGRSTEAWYPSHTSLNRRRKELVDPMVPDELMDATEIHMDD